MPIELKGRVIRHEIKVHLKKGKSSIIKTAKKMRGAITEDDIMYKDKLVCILKPEVKKGILIYHSYNQPEDIPSLCSIGLKTGQLLHNKNKVNLGDRRRYDPYIFLEHHFLVMKSIIHQLNLKYIVHLVILHYQIRYLFALIQIIHMCFIQMTTYQLKDPRLEI